MKTYFASKLIVECLIGSKYIRLNEPFTYYSEYLNLLILIPADFICDFESVPLIKASSRHAGVIHDYFCRKDSRPIVTKQEAATLYLEAQTYRDSLLDDGFMLNRFIRRWFKTLIVRVVPGYFHKHKVLSTLKEIKKK